MAAEYPERPAFFAHRVVRLILRTCAAQEIGQDGILLVMAIAHTEDAKRYTAPVTYWNDQLRSILAFNSWGKLDRARKRAVEAGWLHYEPGGKGRVGKYWVGIPPEFAELSDDPLDEDFLSTSGETNALSSPPVVKETGGKPVILSTGGERSGGEAGEKRGTSGDHSYLNLNPTPKRARFTPPTIEEVTAYCRERKNTVDPQAWYDHYTSNGWKVGKNAMKDWKAAVRTWERNELGGRTDARSQALSGRHRASNVAPTKSIKV